MRTARMIPRRSLPFLQTLAPVCLCKYSRIYCTNTHDPYIEELGTQILQHNRAALAKAITLIESTRSDHRKQSYALLEYLQQKSLSQKPQTSFRIGISGPPGVGKSTFLESFGLFLLNTFDPTSRLAILAVDPSSVRTGGSILGDKTRMPELSRHPRAYIRPSASRGTLGGVARNTSEAIVLCESAGYDLVFVETVGVGQSEVAVEGMVDLFCAMVPPAGGDELQGMKKGLLELADMIIVNKADGDLVAAAKRAEREYLSALRLIKSKYENGEEDSPWKTPVVAISAKESRGLAELWKAMRKFKEEFLAGGSFPNERLLQKREAQRKKWMWRIVDEELSKRIRTNPRIADRVTELEGKVLRGELTPGHAADYILDLFFAQR